MPRIRHREPRSGVAIHRAAQWIASLALAMTGIGGKQPGSYQTAKLDSC
jgi:hypothetical protein